MFNTIEGRSVTYSDKRLGEKLYELKNFGIHGPEEVDAVGANAKMNEYCAAMGLCNLKHIDEEIIKRGRIAERYRTGLSGVDGIQLNAIQADVIMPISLLCLRKRYSAQAVLKYVMLWLSRELALENISIR